MVLWGWAWGWVKGGGAGRVEKGGEGGPKPRRSGGSKGGGPEISRFFPSPDAKFVLFFPLWGSSRGILVVFEAPGP